MAKAFPGPIERGCLAEGEVPDAIPMLASYCPPPCDVDDVPDIPLDPDQRDVQLPPILPPRDVRTIGGFCRTEPGAGSTLGTTSTTNLTAQTDELTRPNNPGAAVRSTVTVMTRAAYDNGDEIAAFFRTYNYDSCGGLISVGPETKQTLADVGGCPEPEFDAYFGTSGNLDADQIADGTISNTEFQYLGGLSAPIQDQIDGKQDHSVELDAIAGASSNGYLVRLGTGAYAFRSITAGSGVTVSNPDGTTGDTEINALPPESGGVTDGDKGDILVSAGGTAWTIDAGVVTLGKLADIATDRLIGRDTAGTGSPEALTVGGGLEFTGAGGIQRSALTGDVTASAGSGSTTIANDAVTYAKMQDVTAGSRLIGRGDSGAGSPEEITLGTNLSMSGTTLNATGAVSDGDKGDITVTASGATWTIDPGVVTYAKMQDVSATSRFLGRISGGAGDVEELTGAQATTLLDAFTSGLKGLAPASGGGTTNYLRADGSWAAPPGTSGSPAGSNTQVQYNNSGSFGASGDLTFNSATPSLAIGESEVTGGLLILYGAASPGRIEFQDTGGATTLLQPGTGPCTITTPSSSGTLALLTDVAVMAAFGGAFA